jgi:hypothetical protein
MVVANQLFDALTAANVPVIKPMPSSTHSSIA